MTRTPDFFIVGAPRSGTTALYYLLKQHPHVFMSEVKELLFFGSDLQYQRYLTLKEFTSHFSAVSDEKRVGTSHVAYLYSKSAPSEIRTFSPNADIIIMLRNPVDMMYSLHSYNLYSCVEDINNFSEALNAEQDRKMNKRLGKNVANYSPVLLFYREMAKYSAQLQRYYQIFGRGRCHVIIYDDFKADPENIYYQTVAFLGANVGFKPKFATINANREVRSAWLQNFFFHSPKPVQRVARMILPKVTRRSLLRVNAKFVDRPPLDSELRHRLQKDFTPDVEDLSNLLNRDLTHWIKG
jgi:hypothetical protein